MTLHIKHDIRLDQVSAHTGNLIHEHAEVT